MIKSGFPFRTKKEEANKMEKKLEILVVEDNPKHLEDAKAEMEKNGQHVDMNVDYAGTLDEAMELVAGKAYDGIISDVFFPVHETAEEGPNGVKMADYALDNDIAIVLCTSTYHHGEKTEPVNKYSRQKGVTLVDVFIDMDNVDSEAEKKNFEGAFASLMARIEFEKAGKNMAELVKAAKEGIAKQEYEAYRELKDKLESAVIEAMEKYKIDNKAVSLAIHREGPSYMSKVSE